MKNLIFFCFAAWVLQTSFFHKTDEPGSPKKSTPIIHSHSCSWTSSTDNKNNDEEEEAGAGSASPATASLSLRKKGHYNIGFLADKGKKESLENSYRRMYGVLESEELPSSLHKVVFGQYNIKLGHGIATSTSGSSSISFARKQEALKPCKSKERNKGLHGVGIHIKQDKLDAIFYSAYNTPYATIEGGEREEERNIKSIPSTGTSYKSDQAREERQVLTEKLGGGALRYQITPDIQVGAQAIAHSYSLPWNKDIIKGHHHGNISVWDELHGKKHQIMGEVATSQNGGIGFLLGHKVKWPKKYYTTGFGYYSPSFYALHGTGHPKERGKGLQKLSIGGDHMIGGIKNSHRFQYSQPIRDSQGTNFSYILKPSYQVSQALALSATLGLKKCSNKPYEVGGKITSKYTYQDFRFDTTLATSSKDASRALEAPSIGLSQNITYAWGPLSAKAHASIFCAPQALLRFHTPDIKVPSLTPPTKGTGYRLGAIATYRLQETLSLQIQGYWSHSEKNPINLAYPKIKLQLSYNA